MNKVGADLFLKSTDGVPTQGFAVKRGFVVVITKLSNSVTPVGFSASDARGNSLLLNGKSEFILNPSVTKGTPIEITATSAQGNVSKIKSTYFHSGCQGHPTT